MIKYWRFWQIFVKLYVITKKKVLIDLSKTVHSWSAGVETLKNIGSLKACNVICKQREKIGQYILYILRKKLRQGPCFSGILLFIGLYAEFNVYTCSVFSVY